ncbi:hypothetical protein LOZ65_002243 [Ophidiomyces ophidiicola]|nr:hypothetical protein LOZ65_002243 [Ophidiomyces ophidiicola]
MGPVRATKTTRDDPHLRRARRDANNLGLEIRMVEDEIRVDLVSGKLEKAPETLGEKVKGIRVQLQEIGTGAKAGTEIIRDVVSISCGFNPQWFSHFSSATLLIQLHALDYHLKSSRYHERSRSRSRSPTRHNTKIRTRSPPRRGSRPDRRDIGSRSVPPDDDKGPNGSTGRKGHSSISKGTDGIELAMDLENGEVDSLMFKTMGFKSFRSTQNTKVPGNQIYGVRKEKKTEYRQYMNRVGGFNRPLSPSR